MEDQQVTDINAVDSSLKLNQDADVLIIQTGGTIDKSYPSSMGGYGFEITSPAVERVFARVNPSLKPHVISVCRKDSQDLNDADRENLYHACELASQEKILITHGTDTMLQTATFLAQKELNKIIVITGAFKPEAFKDSDADFNIGVALGALHFITKKDVYVAMNGGVYLCSEAVRDLLTGQFKGKGLIWGVESQQSKCTEG